jgi:hypothetical protein
MPWEVTIKHADGLELGDFEYVQQQINTALPGIQFCREPSGLEKIAAARKLGVEFPEVILRHFETLPAKVGAMLSIDELVVSLYGFGAQPLLMIHAEFRGEGNPLPVLASLCKPNGWLAVDDASGERVDLTELEGSGWEAFRSFRDHAVNPINASEGDE